MKRESVTLRGGQINFAKDVGQRLGDVPAGIVRLHFGKIADVADVVAGAVLIHVFVIHFLAAQRRRVFKRFENGNAVGTAAADVIDLAATRILVEGMNEARDVERMDVVANLLAFVTKNFVETAFDVAFDEVAQEAVQLHAAVIRTGETTAAQTAGLHAKVASVFLHHHIAGNFRCAKDAVLALVNRELLGDAVRVGRVVIIPARGEFLEADGVRAVAIDFVRAHVRKHAGGHMQARGFEQIQGADGVDIKIIERARGGEVVARLRGGVDEQLGFQGFEERGDRLAIADVEFVVVKIFVRGEQAALIPAGVAARTEKVRAHVVVHAMHFPAKAAEMRDDFRSDES